MQKFYMLIENHCVFSIFQEITASSPNHAIALFSDKIYEISESENNVVEKIYTEEKDHVFYYDICDLPENCKIVASAILNNMYILATIQ